MPSVNFNLRKNSIQRRKIGKVRRKTGRGENEWEIEQAEWRINWLNNLENSYMRLPLLKLTSLTQVCDGRQNGSYGLNISEDALRFCHSVPKQGFPEWSGISGWKVWVKRRCSKYKNSFLHPQWEKNWTTVHWLSFLILCKEFKFNIPRQNF